MSAAPPEITLMTESHEIPHNTHISRDSWVPVGALICAVVATAAVVGTFITVTMGMQGLRSDVDVLKENSAGANKAITELSITLSNFSRDMQSIIIDRWTMTDEQFFWSEFQRINPSSGLKIPEVAPVKKRDEFEKARK